MAKAGIVTQLNARASVLACGNCSLGKYDFSKQEENVNFDPAILARFDAIFILEDEIELENDQIVAKHVLNLHGQSNTRNEDACLSIDFIKQYLTYAKANCHPRLSEESAEIIKMRYCQMRAGLPDQSNGLRMCIPVTIRQLESLIR